MTPPARVLAAFGVHDEDLEHQRGGISQTVWRAGDIVLKPVQEPNPGEGAWMADVLDAIVEDGFRVARPVRASNGAWLYAGWTAWRWIEGRNERTNWRSVTTGAQRLHAAMNDAVAGLALDPQPAWLATRSHRWARSERAVWHGAALPATLNNNTVEWAMYDRAVALGPPLGDRERTACQVVHGDVAGNVLSTPDGLAFIDVSPGWRTPQSVDAQIAVEAVAWFGAAAEILDGHRPADLARGCAFRLLCGLQASADWATEFPGEIEAWNRVLDLIGA